MLTGQTRVLAVTGRPYVHKTQEGKHFELAFYGYKLSSLLNTIGADDKIRTYDLMITNQLLYQLSYIGLLPLRAANENTSKPRLSKAS